MIYVDDVKAQIAALSTALNQVEDIDEASVAELTAMRTVAHATAALVISKVAELDPSLTGDDAVIAGVASGAFPLDALDALDELAGSLAQMNSLLDCLAYAGRIEANLKQAAG
jgi:hypothetical protein